MLSQTPDQFEEALGVYVGEVTGAEAVAAIAAHSGVGATFVARLTTPSGELVWHKSLGPLTTHINGWNDIVLADSEGDEHDDERSDVFVFGGTDSAHFPASTLFADVPLVLDLSGNERHLPGLEQFSGGMRLTFTGAVLTLVFWHSILHETESGDLAPGFGAFRSKVHDDEEGD